MTVAHCISPKQRYRRNPPESADITKKRLVHPSL